MSDNRPLIPIDEPCNWTAVDFSLAPKPNYLLDEAMIKEIETAAEGILAEGRPHYEWRKRISISRFLARHWPRPMPILKMAPDLP